MKFEEMLEQIQKNRKTPPNVTNSFYMMKNELTRGLFPLLWVINWGSLPVNVWIGPVPVGQPTTLRKQALSLF